MEAKYVHYHFTLSEDALGVVVDLHGPGVPSGNYGVHTQQHLNDWAEKLFEEYGWESRVEREAMRIVDLLNAAYAAGKRDRSEELRQLLGVQKER